MLTCGHCKKPVAASDITCPHCGVLLAAYASPTGSGAAGTYQAPAPPPETTIPDVDMEVKPPSETEVVTDPNEVAQEMISTAPRPLFDTALTVEAIVEAAEGDHTEDVVTIKDDSVPTKKVEFDIPDYARPPSHAAPIPTIEEDDASVPLITRDNPVAPESPVDTQDNEEDESDPDPDPAPAAESWLRAAPAPTPQPRPRARRPALPVEQPEPEPKTNAGPVGQTDTYLRRLHDESGYEPMQASISRPVEERRISPRERAGNRRPAPPTEQAQMAAASQQSFRMGCSILYVLVLIVMWISVFISFGTGGFSPFLIFVTFAMTWGYGPMRRMINQMSQ